MKEPTKEQENDEREKIHLSNFKRMKKLIRKKLGFQVDNVKTS